MERIGRTLTDEQLKEVKSLISSGRGPNEATETVLRDGTPSVNGPDGGEAYHIPEEANDLDVSHQNQGAA